KEIRSLPTKLMREANLEELREMDREIRNNIDPRPRSPALGPTREPSPSDPAQSPSQPPSAPPDNYTEQQ
ncbi:MAG TPA: hypothetical protein VK888_04915, partial [Anaerolineales bacterium]|nr:hypothetical protein [Anaerolineales bacterium]